MPSAKSALVRSNRDSVPYRFDPTEITGGGTVGRDPDWLSAIAFVGARQPCRSAWTSALTGPALPQGRVVDLSTIETARDSSVQAP